MGTCLNKSKRTKYEQEGMVKDNLNLSGKNLPSELDRITLQPGKRDSIPLIVEETKTAESTPTKEIPSKASFESEVNAAVGQRKRSVSGDSLLELNKQVSVLTFHNSHEEHKTKVIAPEEVEVEWSRKKKKKYRGPSEEKCRDLFKLMDRRRIGLVSLEDLLKGLKEGFQERLTPELVEHVIIAFPSYSSTSDKDLWNFEDFHKFMKAVL